MNTPHTPGPWSCERFPSSADDHDLIVYRVWSDSADKMVCICKAQTVHKCQANAHLIASAPTLLSQRNELREALKLLLKDEHGGCNHYPQGWEQARAALASTGEGM